MRALLIGGTGIISTAISERCVKEGWELYLLNRGNRSAFIPKGAKVITADMRNTEDVKSKIGDMQFDVVANFIAYTAEDVQRDIEVFAGKTKQYFFVSSASAYQKPLSGSIITEGTLLANPYWKYSQDKTACEDVLIAEYRKSGFPITIIRPSHTYDKREVPLALSGKNGSFAVVDRIRQGKKVIVPGDGLNLWTLTHADDFSVAFCGLMGNIHAIGEIFHITGDERLTWNQVFQAVGNALGVTPNLVHISADTLAALCPSYSGSLLGDKSNCAVFDNTKIKRAVPAFNATIRFDEGIRKTIDFIYATPEFQVPDPEFDAWCDALIEQYESAVKSFPKYDME